MATLNTARVLTFVLVSIFLFSTGTVVTTAADIASDTIVVATDGSGDAATLRQAVQDVEVGGHIRLGPGVHEGGVDVYTDVVISGATDGSSVIVVPQGRPGINVHDAMLTLELVSLRSDSDNDAPSPSAIRLSGGSATIDRCTISNVRVAIRVGDGAQAVVTDCTIGQISESAFEVLGEGTHAVIRGNLIADSEDGIAIAAGASARVEDNEIDVRRHGFSIKETGSPQIIGNTVTSRNRAVVIDDASPRLRRNHITGGSAVVNVFGGARATIEGNTLTARELNALQIVGEGTDPDVRRNEIKARELGIAVRDGARPAIDGNVITVTGGTGILATGEGSAPTIRGNSVSGGSDGIVVASGADGTVTGNSISGNETGIYVHGEGSDPTVIDNVVSGSQWGVDVEDGSSPLIEGNALNGHSQIAIHVEDTGTAPTIRGNSVSASGGGIQIVGGADGIVEDNTIIDHEIAGNQWGIAAADGSSPLIEGNTISDNGVIGVQVSGAGTSPTIEGNTLRGNGTDLDVGLLATPTVGDNDLEANLLPVPRSLDEAAPEIMARVEGLRGLRAQAAIPVRWVDPQQAIAEHLAELEAEDVDEIKADEMLLKRVGLLPADMDLLATLEAFIQSEVAGYFRPEAGDIAIVSGDDDGLLAQVDEIVLAHEYVHALQDQHFGIETTGDAAADGDESTAFTALVEGDATFLMMALVIGDAMSSAPSLAAPAGLSGDESILDTMPLLLRREMLFPYFDGMGFVQRIWGRGGWSAIDDVWLDPPVSTEQIMHPTLYPSEQPIPVHLPDVTQLLGADWTVGYETTMGEQRIGVLVADDESFEMPLFTLVGVTLPNAEAAAGWGGDRIVTVDGGEGEWVVVWQTAWDTSEDAAEFAEAARDAMEDLAGVHVVAVGADVADAAPDDQSVLLLVADSATTMSRLEEALELT